MSSVQQAEERSSHKPQACGVLRRQSWTQHQEGWFVLHRVAAIRTRRAWLPNEKSTVFQRVSGSRERPGESQPIVLGLFKRRADLLRVLGQGKKRCGLLASVRQ